MSCLDKLINVTMEISYDSTPPQVTVKAKQCLADFVGVSYEGTREMGAINLRKALGGRSISTNPGNLALWLGSAARMPDLDDGHRVAMGHPGVVINSTAVAMARVLPDMSGKKMLEAIVRGYEVYCYQGRVINPSAYLQRGVDATGICGSGAAAMVAGTMMGMSSGQITHAISLAASLAGGLNQAAIDGSAQKFLLAGWAAKLGIEAANLARHGLDGPRHVFEGTLGFCNAFSPEPDLEYLRNPQLVWDILNVYFKVHACVRRIHATLDAVKAIVEREKLPTSQINHVQVFGGAFLCDAAIYRPRDMAQAQTSVPYVVAILLAHGKVSSDLIHGNISNEQMAALSDKISVLRDEEMARLTEEDGSLWGAARVEITTMDGRVFSETRIYPGGDPENPFSERIVYNKFLGLAKDTIDSNRAEALWEDISYIDDNPHVEKLFSHLIAESR